MFEYTLNGSIKLSFILLTQTATSVKWVYFISFNTKLCGVKLLFLSMTVNKQ